MPGEEDKIRSEKREYHRNWRLNNPGKAAAATRKWRLNHPERAREVDLKAETNRDVEKRRVTRRKYYAEHPEIVAKERQFVREWRSANPQKQRDASRKWYENNKERHRAAARVWNLKNREKLLEAHRKWKADNPEQVKADNAARNNRIRGYGGQITRAQVLVLHEKQRGTCAACQKKIGMNYHLDHVMPLSLGGAHHIDNTQILCPKCNLSKGSLHPDDWAARIGRLFA